MTENIPLDFEEISHAIKCFSFPQVDHVIGIATGGSVPASLIAYQLNCPLGFLQINYRAPDNSLAHPAPILLREKNLPKNKRVLLVDDVSVTGETLSFAAGLLKHNEVLTFVLKGKADYVLFPQIGTCVDWPWKI